MECKFSLYLSDSFESLLFASLYFPIHLRKVVTAFRQIFMRHLSYYSNFEFCLTGVNTTMLVNNQNIFIVRV